MAGSTARRHDSNLARRTRPRHCRCRRIARFNEVLGGKSFPEDRDHRFMRDFAAELLHNVYPEHYPLMQRWVWDAKQNTGVLREIWHDAAAGDNVDTSSSMFLTATKRSCSARRARGLHRRQRRLPRRALVHRSAASPNLRRLHQRSGWRLSQNRFLRRSGFARTITSHPRPRPHKSHHIRCNKNHRGRWARCPNPQAFELRSPCPSTKNR